MCTISFFPVTEEHWFLGMNRDERKSRPAAIPPELKYTESGTRYICPTDTQAGGTWLGVNSYGLVFMLINNYQAVNPEAAHRSDLLSRGLVIPYVMDEDSVEAVLNSINQIDASRYNPFTLFIFSRKENRIAYFGWGGHKIDTGSITPEPLIRISSGFDPDEAYRIRLQDFEHRYRKASAIDADWMKSLHKSTWPEPGALSIAMLQENVMSVSATVLELNPLECNLHYCNGWPGSEVKWIESHFPL